MLTPRKLSRRAIALALVSGFVVGLYIVSARLPPLCDSAESCHVAGFRHRLPFGGEGGFPVWSGTTAGGSGSGSGSGSAPKPDAECAGFPDTSRVLLVMKTGASEAFNRIPGQVLTNLRCLSNSLIFSDMAQEVAGHSVHDSLDTVVAEVKATNSDFGLYHRQQQCPVDVASCNKHHDVAQEAWKLDKYKNIHMAEKAYVMRPGHDWYLFVDADTYILWPSMMRWLDKLDHTKPQYIGSVAYVGTFPFGHGGSGYLVSQAAMHQFFGNGTGVANRWDEAITTECCGDYMFSKALHAETGISVQHAWPSITGETAHTFTYGDDAWCEPIATLHHVSVEEVSDMWAFEKQRLFAGPVRIRDLYRKFVAPRLEATRDDWDNLSDDFFYLNTSASAYSEWELERVKPGELTKREAVAHRSFDDCRRACQSDKSCMQYRFWNGICSVSRSIRHGKPAKKEEDKWWEYRSGWMVDRIQAWIRANDDCGAMHFPLEAKP